MPETKTSSRNTIPEKSSYIPHVARGALINFSGIISRMAFVYIYMFILARMLSVNDLGAFFIAFTIINIVGLAALLGLDHGVVRYVSLYTGEGKFGQARKAVRAALLIGIPGGATVAILLFLLAPAVSRQFMDSAPGSILVMRVFALAVPFMVAARLFNATTQGMHRMQYQVYSRDIGEQVFKVALTLTALAIGTGLLGVVWANVAAVILAAAASLFFALMVLPKEIQGKPRKESAGTGREEPSRVSPIREMIKYSYPLAFATVLVSLWMQVDTLLLGYLGSTEDVGYYGVALKLSMFSGKIISAFVLVFAPIIADLSNRNRAAELKEIYLTVSRWIFILCLPIFICLTLFSNSLMNVFGASYVVANKALIVLALGQLMNAATGAAGIMVLMSGRSKLEFLNVAVALTVDVIICLWLIPKYGFMGAAIAHMLSLGLANLMRVTEVWVFMKMLAYDLSFLKPVLAGVSGAAVVLLLSRFVIVANGIMQIAVLAAILLFAYAVVMAVLGLDEQDRMLIQKLRASVAGSKTS